MFDFKFYERILILKNRIVPKKTFLFLIAIIFITFPEIGISEKPLETHKTEQKDIAFPIGDRTNVEVYTFIKEALLRSETYSLKKAQAWREQEINQIDDTNFKPHSADIYEGELGSLLRLLCQAQPELYEITLYQKDGIGIATSGLKEEVTFTPSRIIDFRVCILSPSVIKNLKRYDYKSLHNEAYREILRAIYESNENHFAYLGTQKRNPKDHLIGYVSYLIRIRQR